MQDQATTRGCNRYGPTSPQEWRISTRQPSLEGRKCFKLFWQLFARGIFQTKQSAQVRSHLLTPMSLTS